MWWCHFIIAIGQQKIRARIDPPAVKKRVRSDDYKNTSHKSNEKKPVLYMLCVHIELLLEAAPKAPSSFSSLSPLFFLMHSRRSSRDGGWALYLVSSLLSRCQSSPVCSRVDTTSTSRVWNNREKKKCRDSRAHTNTHSVHRSRDFLRKSHDFFSLF